MPKYSSTTVSSYNSSPPPDDGSTGTNNKITWDKIKTKLTDPLNSFASAVNSAISAAVTNTLLSSTATKSGSFTVDVTEDGMGYSCSGTGTASLPAVSGVYQGFSVVIKNDGAAVTTVDGNGSETVGGTATQTLDPGEWALVVCDGANWLWFPVIASVPVTTAFTQTLLDDSDATTARATLGLVIGTDVQAYSASNGAFGTKLLHVQDQKSSGTAGGSSTSGSFQTRTLNTVVTNEISGASLSSNQITLPAGTYYVEAKAPVYASDLHRAKLRNTTDSVDLVLGTNEFASSGSNLSSSSFVFGRFTLSGAKTVELQHRVSSSKATDGYGNATSFSLAEIYSDVRIWRIA